MFFAVQGDDVIGFGCRLLLCLSLRLRFRDSRLLRGVLAQVLPALWAAMKEPGRNLREHRECQNILIRSVTALERRSLAAKTIPFRLEQIRGTGCNRRFLS